MRVVAADARTVRLPRRAFTVVANLPYSISTPLLRRLLGAEETALTGADVLVEWGFAKRLTADPARDFETAWWQARFELTVARRVRPAAFEPAPSVDSAHLVIRRRPGVTPAAGRAAWRYLRAQYRRPGRRGGR